MRHARRKALLIPAVALAVLAAPLAGCGSSEPPKVAGTTTEGKAAEPATLQIVKWPELERAIAAHKGKVVVIDIWAEY